MTTTLLATTVSAEDFQGVSIHGRRLAVQAIVTANVEGLSHTFTKEYLWDDGLPPVKARLYPNELVEQVLKLPIDVRWAIAAEISYGLAADEEVDSDAV